MDDPGFTQHSEVAAAGGLVDWQVEAAAGHFGCGAQGGDNASAHRVAQRDHHREQVHVLLLGMQQR